MNLESRIYTVIINEGLLEQGEDIAVGFSGGADSSVLLRILKILKEREKTGWRITAAHFNHRLRSTADRDESFCRKTAEQMGIAFVSDSCDVGAYARDKRISVEAAARECRYRFFRSLGMKTVCAHHMNDNSETILFNIIRGTGMQGITGMNCTALINGVRVVRPMLGIMRSEIIAYSREHDVQFVQDETNDDVSYSRNRIRHRIIPAMETINPSAVSNIVTMAEHVQAGWQIINSYIDELEQAARIDPDVTFHQQTTAGSPASGPEGPSPRGYEAGSPGSSGPGIDKEERSSRHNYKGTCNGSAAGTQPASGSYEPTPRREVAGAKHREADCVPGNDNCMPLEYKQLQKSQAGIEKIVFDNTVLRSADRRLRDLFVLRMLERTQARTDTAAVTRIAGLIEREDRGTVCEEAGNGVSVCREYDRLIFSCGTPETDPSDFRYELAVPGECRIPETGIVLRCTAVSLNRELYARILNNPDRTTAYLDSSALRESLCTVRTRRPGDTFHPLGSPGEKKLQDFFTDEKVPAAHRGTVPILESGGEIVWVVGMRISEHAKVVQKTGEVFRIEARRL